MTKTVQTDVLIIGSGPAGYTAAIYAARANLKPHLVSGLEPGGQLTITTDVENYPGFGDVIQGPWLMEQMKEQALKVGTKFHHDIVNSVKFDDKPFLAETDSGLKFNSKTIIIATGAQARWLNLESENKFKGFGISACATCDGFFFKDIEVVVVGGGDSAMEEALFLTKFAKKVYVVHRRDSFRASKIMQDRVINHEQINVLWNKEITEIKGDKKVSSVTVKDLKENTEEDMNIDGVFLAIGHTPNVSFLEGLLELDDKGYIKTGFTTDTSTSVPGIFAAGDVADSVYRQAITAAGTGCQAAIDAERWLDN